MSDGWLPSEAANEGQPQDAASWMDLAVFQEDSGHLLTPGTGNPSGLA
jgi:hypothetical protein